MKSCIRKTLLSLAIAAGSFLLTDSSKLTAFASEATIFDNQGIKLSEQKIGQLWDQVQTDIEKSYAGVYTFDNYDVKLIEAEQEDGSYIINLDIMADMTLIRNPEQCPMIIGMKDAASLIEDSFEKERANDVISEYLDEFMQYYDVPIQTGFLYQVHIPTSSNYSKNRVMDMQIYHRIDLEDEKVLLTPIEMNPFFTEMMEENDGAEILNSALNASTRGLMRAVSYNRAAAVTYAINHATDEPEFTNENHGSDCANFVSKCLNAGGIPADVAGEWYPGATWASLGGKHWFRTGYNVDNGGVILYMKDKGYFSSCSVSQVNTGCIMYWNNTSHVALVTQCDGSTIKYSEHSSTKKDATFYTYNANSQSITFYKSNI